MAAMAPGYVAAMWFDSWSDLWRILLVGAGAYAVLVLVLRVSGKRTLAKLNAFDFVVTVALGSTLATILLSSDVSWAEGAVALATLAGLQLMAALASARIPGGRNVLTSEPSLVLRDGRLLREAMRRHRLSESDVRQAVRRTGAGDLGDVAAVVLETDGSMSVIPTGRLGDGSALHGVENRR